MKERLILAIGDAHVDEHQDLDRFAALGKLIVDRKPTDIILMGDFLTLNCLSHWDRDKRLKMEGLRYTKELAAGNEALDLMLNPLLELQKRQRASKHKPYKPNLVYIEGNHEDRLSRYFETDPTFLGAISIERDLSLKSRGFTWVPYKKYHYINDIGFTHIPFNKAKAIGGMDITRKAQLVTVKSVVFGHTHELHTSNLHTEGMPHLQQVLNVGCFFEKNEAYVEGRVTNYWKGVCLLHNYGPQRFDIETVSMARLKATYAP